MRKARIIIMMLLTFSLGITYSIFQSGADINIDDQDIAKFIFDTKVVDEIEVPIINMIPGSNEEYQFSVTNNYDELLSDVTIKYQIIVNTYHFIPLDIKLYKIDGEEVLFGECSETYSRSETNELICIMPILSLSHSEEEIDNFSLKISFPEEYNDESFSGLVDFIKLDIKSWQKMGG